MSTQALKGKRVAISVGRRTCGSIGETLFERLTGYGISVMRDSGFMPRGAPDTRADIAVCTTGKMLIQDPDKLGDDDLDEMCSANYLLPRAFIERHIHAMKINRIKGLIIVIGSNSARYGKPFADDYAAMKAALWKYCEIRGKGVAQYGIRITCVNLGGVVNGFWDRVRAGNFNAEIAEDLIPRSDKGMTNSEVVDLLITLMCLPENLAVKDLLVVGRAYQ